MPALVRFVVALALCVGAIQVVPGRALAGQLSEYQWKAAFLLNFPKFIDWPTRPRDVAAPLLIGIVGLDPFGRNIDDTVRGNRFPKHPTIVKRIDWRDDLTRFHILFISASEEQRVDEILRRVESSDVLTVSDIDGFCTRGGIIAFVTDGDRIRFEVNTDAAQQRKLRVSSKLLSLAARTHAKGNQP